MTPLLTSEPVDLAHLGLDAVAFEFMDAAGFVAGNDDWTLDAWDAEAVLVSVTLGGLPFTLDRDRLTPEGAAHVARIEAARAEAHRETLEAEAPGGRVARCAA